MQGVSRKAVYAVLGACSALATLPAFAQAYPAKQIEVTVHTSAGSGGDIVSRAVAEVVRRDKLLPQQLMVVNRVGGSGALAFNYFRKQKGDPYQLLSVTGTILVMAYRPDINIPLDQYTPVALMTIDPQTIMVPATFYVQDLKDMAEAVRKGTPISAAQPVGDGHRPDGSWLMEKHIPARKSVVNFKGGADAVTSTAGAIPRLRPTTS